MTARESMAFDVVIVGAGPAGLAAACRLMQQSQATGQALSVCVVEKGAEVGAHILSGALFEPSALNQLFPDWQSQGAPVRTRVQQDSVYLLRSATQATRIPHCFLPKTLDNQDNYVISLGNLCRWLAAQATALGVEIFPGFAAQDVLFDDNGRVQGIITDDRGVSAAGQPKDNYLPGMALQAQYTLFAEGCRGHLGKRLIDHFRLDYGRDPQHYALGIKELWTVPAAQHRLGQVIHTVGWPLADSGSHGGGFLYHLDDHQVAVGLITDLNYRNPYVSPFNEFQRFKHHPVIQPILAGGKRIAYGARALTKGGLQSLPKMTFPGGLLIGCDAGTLNMAKLKGSHTAMQSGILAAETVFKAISNGLSGGEELTDFTEAFNQSSVYRELYHQRNVGPALHQLGPVLGGAVAYLDINLCRGKLPFTLHDRIADHQRLQSAKSSQKIHYPKPDGVISFDCLSSVFLTNTQHVEDQPCHLQLADAEQPIRHNLPVFAEPAQRYCPAGVYEIITNDATGKPRLQINSQNCIHCKTCDIKDPTQNITWVAPEGGSGPSYPNL